MQKFDSAHGSCVRSDARKRASIVVIDPSPLSLIATAGVMDYQGYAVVCARTAQAGTEAFSLGPQDLVLWDVADDAAGALDDLATMRQQTGYEELPAVLIADSMWAGLEKKADSMDAATRCLFKPIDPNSLIAVVHQLLYMPTLVKAHQRRGKRSSRPGWISL